jgi:phospho-N-acetylmuramoyl-pentapeptide-transferase
MNLMMNLIQMASVSIHLQPLLTALLVLVLTLVCGWAGLPLLRHLKVGQTVRDDGPKTHLKKTGTPTFGGFFFLIPLTLFGLFAWLRGGNLQPAGVVVLLMLTFGLTGFLDDYIKVRVSKKGLSVRQKTILMLIFSTLFAVYYLFLAPAPAFFLLPFSGRVLPILGWIRLPYAVFVILVLFFTSNSVNLTDGVDGLASSVTIISAAGLAAAGLIIRTALPAAEAGIWLSLAIAAGCLGFLAFNRHPARVFMGDTGSQALGAGITGIALIYGAPWLILFMGFIYMVESASVMIQVAYFKKTGGKRIFRMSPIHHHYELGGWAETKIVGVFSLVTLAGSLIGLLLL